MPNPTNDHRGELWVEIKDQRYPLKLTLDAIRRAEVAASSSWQELTSRTFEGKLRLDDIAALVWAGMEGGRSANQAIPTLDEVLEFLYDEGIFSVNPVVRELVALQALGARHAEDFLRAVAEKEPEREPQTLTGTG